jgi:hypothetical protein
MRLEDGDRVASVDVVPAERGLVDADDSAEE